MTRDEIEGRLTIPSGWRIGRLGPLTSQGYSAARSKPYLLQGTSIPIPLNAHWKYDPAPGGAMDKLVMLNRVRRSGKSIASVLLADDNPVTPLDNVWLDTGTGSFTEDQVYVVQTGTKVVQRCVLMTTDPGDLVLDPTCGSGTTAYVSEQWGRRWITIDTSRVALTLARQRIMGARYPHYSLADSPEGRTQEQQITGQPQPNLPTARDVRKGFVYKRVPHVTLKSIANNPDIVEGMSREKIDAAIARHAEIELLYDQPYEDKSTVRVAGPFTVESMSPYRAFEDTATLPKSQGVDEDSTSSFERMLLDNLRKSGVQNGRRAERFEFDGVERLPGRYVIARVVPRGNLADQRVAVSIGPRYGTVGADWIKASALEAMRGRGYDVLLVMGFAFDPRALEMVEEFKPDESEGFAVQAVHEAGGIRILLVRMNADLAMGESMLKKSKAANLFTVFGEPDISAPQWTEEGWVVTINGFDVYNPVTGEVRPGGHEDIAMWMIDTDYDEESFFVRHAYFLGADPYERLRKALKAEIDPEAWESLNSASSRPFAHPSTRKIAVKVVNHYGDELLTVLDLPTPPTG
jgi:adenine-specific DNA-methyltransferase